MHSLGDEGAIAAIRILSSRIFHRKSGKSAMGREITRHFARKPLITLFSLCNPPVIQQGSRKNFCEFRRPAKARFV